MDTDFYKLINRFTNIIILILIIISVSIIFMFSIKYSMDEEKIKEDNLLLINSYIDSNYSKLSKIKENIYLNSYFQKDLIDYRLLAPDKYLTKAFQNGKKPLYLSDTLRAYMDQQNIDGAIENVTLSLESNFYISTNRVQNSSIINFSSKLEFLNYVFPDNQILIQATPKHLLQKLQKGLYIFKISDGISEFILFDDELPSNIPIETVTYKKINIKIYKQNFLLFKKIIYSTVLTFFIMILLLTIIKHISKKYFNSYLLQYADIIYSLDISNYSKNSRIDLSNKTGELKEISKKINFYYDENEKFIEAQKEYERLKLNAQFSSLQNQITPHFLFNNLEFIRMKAFISGQDDISDSIFLLSQLYRNNTYQPDVISIQDELENIQFFLQLHKYRYTNFNFIIDNQISNLNLPKLSLQPFAENYIKHGFSALKETNFLEILCKEYSDIYIITFNDNGIGMSDDHVKLLRKKILEPFNAKEHIGIKNPLIRLNIHFGNRVEILVNTVENKSFSLSLIIKKEES